MFHMAYLLSIDDIHDHATLQHLRQTSLDSEVIAESTVLCHCGMWGVVREGVKEG